MRAEKGSREAIEAAILINKEYIVRLNVEINETKDAMKNLKLNLSCLESLKAGVLDRLRELRSQLK